MILVTLPTVSRTSQADISTPQTFHLVVPKFFTIHEHQRVEQGIYHLVPPNTASSEKLFFKSTTSYSSSSSSSLYRKSDLNGFPQRFIGCFVKFWSREKAREPYHPPIYGFLVLLECLFLQAHAYDLLFCAFWLLFGGLSNGG